MTQPKTLQNEGRTGHTASALKIKFTTRDGETTPSDFVKELTVTTSGTDPLYARGKGRPRVWSKERLRVLVLRLVANHWKRRYCAPTLRQIAIAINATTPMSEEALKKLIQRHGLKWAELKKKIKT